MTAAAQTPSGIALDELDDAVRPQDDLFRHVNGKWIARTDIPADKARYGSFYLLAEQAEEAVREIIEEARDAAPGTEERKVERKLITDYEAILEEVLSRLNAGNHALAVGLAAIPEKIRGFGHVKARHLAAAKADEAALLEQLRSGKPPLLKAAE